MSDQLPIGREGDFKGCVDLITMKAYVYDDDSLGAKYKVEAFRQIWLSFPLNFVRKCWKLWRNSTSRSWKNI